MTPIVNILCDDSACSKNALAGFIGVGDAPTKAHEICIFELDGEIDLIQSLQGIALVLLSPETFSLYRGKLYQMLALNKNIEPYNNFSKSGLKVPRWSYIGEFSRVAANVKVGLMTYIGCNSTISPGANIGSFVWIGNNVTIGPGAMIGNNVTLHDGVTVGAGASIEKFNEIRRNVAPNVRYKSGAIETDFFGATAHIHGI